MTEKEKMLKQMLYDANNDENLLKERAIAKDLCFKYNQLMPSDVENQKKLLKELLGQIDDTASILASFWCDYGYNIKVGKNFFANHNTVIIDCAPVTFGDNVFIAPNCGFYTAGHPIDTKRRNQGLEFAYPITVGNNVWIGAGVQGGSVVVKDIPSNSVAVGNPCHVIREITDKDEQTNWNI